MDFIKFFDSKRYTTEYLNTWLKSLIKYKVIPLENRRCSPIRWTKYYKIDRKYEKYDAHVLCEEGTNLLDEICTDDRVDLVRYVLNLLPTDLVSMTILHHAVVKESVNICAYLKSINVDIHPSTMDILASSHIKICEMYRKYVVPDFSYYRLRVYIRNCIINNDRGKLQYLIDINPIVKKDINLPLMEPRVSYETFEFICQNNCPRMSSFDMVIESYGARGLKLIEKYSAEPDWCWAYMQATEMKDEGSIKYLMSQMSDEPKLLGRWSMCCPNDAEKRLIMQFFLLIKSQYPKRICF